MAEEKHADPGKSRVTIEPTLNGPYIVSGLDDLIDSKGKSLETQETVALCRCGKSSSKPFCDGTHASIGFSGSKESDRTPDKLDDHGGKVLVVHDNRGVCAHIGVCSDHLPAVWKMGVKPWIQPDKGKPKDIAAITRLCPSGALSYTKDGDLVKDHDRTPRIAIHKDGPYRVQGWIILNDPDGNKPESKEHYTLCRCGKSSNKPFCDGKHWDVKFKDDRN